MEPRMNNLGQPVGHSMEGWQAASKPPLTPIDGRLCRLEPTRMDHAADLFSAYSEDNENYNWTYLPYGPFDSENALRSWMEVACFGADPLFHTVIDKASGKAVGVATYLRIEPAAGVIEVGHINFSPLMQRTAMATEAMFLMMRRVFKELGYRRYEWKCDNLNAPSKRAAERLGFRFEGIFRQATLYKNRNRDTAWYAIIDQEWPALEQAFNAWLDVDNFDESGQQKARLGELKAKFGAAE